MADILSIIFVAVLFTFVAYRKFKKRKQPPEKYREGQDPVRDKNTDVEIEKEKGRRPPPPFGGGV